MHGYIKMTHSPNNGSSLSSASDEDSTPVVTPRRKRPTASGVGYPKVAGGSGSGNNGPPKDMKQVLEGTPIPVVLTLGTILKLMVPVLALVSASIAFYWQTRSHCDDKTIHLESGERGKLETKAEANKQREKMVKEIKDRFDVKAEKISVEQTKQVIKLGQELKTEQKVALKEILKEVQRTRRSVRRNRTVLIPPTP
jgi:hypothetical protein